METSRNFKWRSLSQFVAIFHMVRSMLSLVFVLCAFGLGIKIESDLVEQKLKISKADSDGYETFGLTIMQLSIVAAVILFETLVLAELLISQGLYCDTKPETDMPTALETSMSWLVLNGFCIGFGAIFSFLSGIIVCWVLEIVRLASMYVVYKYTIELKQVIKATGIVKPTSYNIA